MATFRKRGGRWQVQVRRKGYPLFTKSFRQRVDAIRWANQKEIELDRNELQIDPRVLTRLTVRDILERYRDEVSPTKKGHWYYKVMINAFLRDSLANRRLSHLSPSHFAAYRDARLRSVGSSTIIRELGIIQRAFEIAKNDWGIPLPINPVKAISKPRVSRARQRRVSQDEWKRLLEASSRCTNRFLRPVATFALETGMRRGELLNARWRDIDWSTSTLLIPVTKSGEPRTIPLSDAARCVLAEVAIDWCDGARIFPTSAEAVKLGWKRWTKRAGVVDLHFHDLRHEAVSRFFERGLSVPEVALISGHKDPRMLFRYTHLKAAEVARKLNAT